MGNPAMTKDAARQISRENAADNRVVTHLQREVANAFILYTNYKHYHWQTYGPLFRDLHKLFDEFAAETLATIDEMAERIRMIGQDPVSTPRQFEETASVKASTEPKTIRDMVEEADLNLMGIIRNMRSAVKAAEEENDPGTVDLFSKIVQIHEKHEWFLREILKKRDGLTT